MSGFVSAPSAKNFSLQTVTGKCTGDYLKKAAKAVGVSRITVAVACLRRKISLPCDCKFDAEARSCFSHLLVHRIRGLTTIPDDFSAQDARANGHLTFRPLKREISVGATEVEASLLFTALGLAVPRHNARTYSERRGWQIWPMH